MPKKRQGRLREYRFMIDAYSPETMPLGRLAEYLTELAVLFGEDKSIHLLRVEKGSTVLLNLVEKEAEPKVRENLDSVARKDASPERMRAAQSIDDKLWRDNAIGAVIDPVGGKLIEFPGRERVESLTYGPFNQPGIIIGIPILIGGKNDPVAAHIQGKDGEYPCVARRGLAKEIAPHLFTNVIRAEGTGRWVRHSNGEWEMKRFMIREFKPLVDVSLREVIQKLREIPAEWKRMEDPLRALRSIRHGTDG